MRIIYCFLMFTVVFLRSALAYLDPGTGSFIFQMLIAALCSCLFFLKSIINWIKRVFGKKNKEIKDASEEGNDDKGE